MSLFGLLSLALAAVLAENCVFTGLLGIESLTTETEKISVSAGMGGVVTAVMTLSACLSWIVGAVFLTPAGAEYLQAFFFVLIVVLVALAADSVLTRFLPRFRSLLGPLVPRLTTNCAVLAVALLQAQRGYTLGTAALYGLFAGAGFTLAVVLFAVLRRRLAEADVPRAFEGLPIALVTAGLLTMAFLGFVGLTLKW